MNQIQVQVIYTQNPFMRMLSNLSSRTMVSVGIQQSSTSDK